MGKYLEQINTKEGGYVSQGTVLFVIDQRPYRIALERANAQLQHARSALKLSQLQFKRAQVLIESHATSQEELDSTRAANEQAEERLKHGHLHKLEGMSHKMASTIRVTGTSARDC